jgi:hypothetical protein
MQVVIPVRLQFVCNDGRPPDAVAACRALRQSRTPVLQGPQSTSRGGRRSKKKRTGAAHGRQHLAAVAAVAAEAAAAEGARLMSEEEGQAEAEAAALSRSRSSRIVGARRLWMRTGRGSTKKGGVLEFKRTWDQRQDYRERGESRARAQHDILIRSLEKVAGGAEGENGGWKIKLIIFVGGTSGSVNVQILNDNLKELQVLESKRNAIRKGLVYELLNAQDTVLCLYFAQR